LKPLRDSQIFKDPEVDLTAGRHAIVKYGAFTCSTRVPDNEKEHLLLVPYSSSQYKPHEKELVSTLMQEKSNDMSDNVLSLTNAESCTPADVTVERSLPSSTIMEDSQGSTSSSPVREAFTLAASIVDRSTTPPRDNKRCTKRKLLADDDAEGGADDTVWSQQSILESACPLKVKRKTLNKSPTSTQEVAQVFGMPLRASFPSLLLF